MKNDLKDSKESLEEDKKFLAQLEKGCGTKEQEWAERQKTRSEELLALAETIKLLTDDDSLEYSPRSWGRNLTPSWIQLQGVSFRKSGLRITAFNYLLSRVANRGGKLPWPIFYSFGKQPTLLQYLR